MITEVRTQAALGVPSSPIERPFDHITFACGTNEGGALDSTVVLAAAARRHGVHAQVLAPLGEPYTPSRAISAAVRSRRFGSRIERAAWWSVERVFLSRGSDRSDQEIVRVRDVPTATSRLAPRPDLLVVSSMRSLDLGRMACLAHRQGIPLLWYLRERSSLDLLPAWGHEVDGILANSSPLAEAASKQSGRPCPFVPSPIDHSELRPPRERTSVLLVNPVPGHGVDVVLHLAELLPTTRFVLQESWSLSSEDTRALRDAVGARANVELRPRRPRHELFEDTSILLAPHGPEIDLSRPRVALEAQFATVPLVGTDTPGLRAVAAAPELLLAHGSSPESWAAALEAVLERYSYYSKVAHEFARAQIGDADDVYATFASACTSLLHERGPR
jgi:glycosyltransferase involved in cell wall biosynthesis